MNLRKMMGFMETAADNHVVNFCTEPCIFTDVLRNIDTGLIILDTIDKKVFFKNNHAVKILSVLDDNPDYDDLCLMLCSDLESLKKPGRTKSRQTIIRHEHRVLGYTVYRLPDDDRYISVFIQDITDRHRLAAMDEAAEMMNNISCLFSGIRHEIGNPLNSIKMAITVLQNNINKYSPEETDVYFTRISGEITKMETLLKSFKNFSMFEVPKTSDVDLRIFFENLMHLLGADIRSKNVEVNIELSPEAQYARIDSRALQHVVMNLFANAIDAMAEQPLPQLTIRSERRDDTIMLSIIDNGCGMAEDLIRDAFKPFFTTKPHGTGLGLVISKKMLAQMNCGIEMSSRKGHGTTFIISMPHGELNLQRGSS
ncbi:MAG TPA: HAMP domain-containing histidine kinase [Deltaproteobacteria bacterium]|nr:HAMP domain-containing histidine kinase [Deltaproteobacteria bacterium]